ncbi:MAG: UvrD-helicase domain-containing protein [Erysipelotrichaceae bacterium]|nr:UvrD-helicase domain-containing protein [Erysipelotrichaceae bacterium]
MGWNPAQQAALDAPLEQNVLVSAGAGSGKTKILSERVHRLISSGQLKPSEILVLTFTNNAAHEMKDRIIKTFKDDPDTALQMESANIQTFDSFSQYLVKHYAGKLGISDTISVASEAVIEVKAQEILDQIFLRYYEDDALRARLLKTLSHFDAKEDTNTKSLVLELYQKLSGLTPSDREAFYHGYDEGGRYRSEELICLLQRQKMISIQKKLKKALYLARSYEAIRTSEATPLSSNDIHSIFGNRNVFEANVTSFHFEDQKYVTPAAECIRSLLEKQNPNEFFIAYRDALNDSDIFLESTKKLPRKMAAASREAYKALREPFFDDEAKAIRERSETLPWEYFRQSVSFYLDDIALLLQMEKELRLRLMEYQKTTNSFTFQDISSFALTLLTDERYAAEAEEIRSHYRYIMIDEYQDTNDFQEAFLDSLCRSDKDGRHASLFCVGDAKQSIYSFRNSNVALFQKRLEGYQNDPTKGKVIDMNLNYRSGQKMLHDINYFFLSYMTKDHGGIDYQNEAEQLHYPLGAGPYMSLEDNDITHRQLADSFGLHRLISKKGNEDYNPALGLSVSEYRKTWECEAIIEDIQTKIRQKFLVYDRDKEPHIRPCEYRDFAVLVRVKSGFPLYQKAFREHQIPLNLDATSDLRKEDAILLLQSIMRLLLWVQQGKLQVPQSGDFANEVKHAWASVARSYAYRRSDPLIFPILAYHDPLKKNDLALLEQDDIFQEVLRVADETKDKSFEDTFFSILRHFRVIEALPYLGEVEANINKIESLHALLVQQSASGEGLESFLSLLEETLHYDVTLGQETTYHADNAVDLMTIHASKGLERKIVYMPVSFNKRMVSSRSDSFYLNEDTGIRFPNPWDQNKEDAEAKNQVEKEEHVRLFYVALTRAENALYIVGDPSKEEQDKRFENLYGMLDFAPHFKSYSQAFLERLTEDKILSPVEVTEYCAHAEALGRYVPALSREDFEAAMPRPQAEEYYSYYLEASDRIDRESAKNELEALESKLGQKIYEGCLPKIAKANDDDLARFFAFYALGENSVLNLSDLAKRLNEADEETEEGNGGADDRLQVLFPNNDIVALRERLHELQSALLRADEDVFHLKTGVNEKDEPEKAKQKRLSVFSKAFLPALAYLCYDYLSLTVSSWKTGDFADPTSVMEISFAKPSSVVTNPSVQDPGQETLMLDFAPRLKERASKKVVFDADEAEKKVLDYGTRLHRYLELMDWKTKDTSFINDPKDRKLIERVLSLPLFQGWEEAEIYPEYGYYDPILNTTGSLDLLVVKKGDYHIIDYKTKHIDDPAYDRQLRIYGENVKRIFKVDERHIHLTLLSLIEGKTRDVEWETTRQNEL